MAKPYMTYIYISLMITIFIILIIIFIKLKKMMINVVSTNNSINNLKEDLKLVDDKKIEIKETKESWQFFIKVVIVVKLIKEIIDKYRHDDKKTRNFAKTFATVCLHNATKIAKLKEK